MKTKIFPIIVLLLSVYACTKSTKPDYLYLNANQLRPLGIELNESGIYYKNENPEAANAKYSCMAFYCTNDNYVTTKHFNATDTLKAVNKADSILIDMELSKNDFYPILIGNNNGIQSLADDIIPADIKLLPIAICMSETKLPNRNDTIIVWLKPSETLKKLLPNDINIDDYLKSKPIDNRSL